VVLREPLGSVDQAIVSIAWDRPPLPLSVALKLTAPSRNHSRRPPSRVTDRCGSISIPGPDSCSSLLRVDPKTDAYERWVQGLGMANGVACAPNGTVYASNDVGTHLDRITPDGTVDRRWARVASANGLAIDCAGRFLYAAQTFVPARVSRIDLHIPESVTTHVRAPAGASASMLDGLAIDKTGRLFVVANGAGQVWRIDGGGTIQIIAGGLRCPSAVALGHGPRGFSGGTSTPSPSPATSSSCGTPADRPCGTITRQERRAARLLLWTRNGHDYRIGRGSAGRWSRKRSVMADGSTTWRG
jgi:hypothetical protein